MKCNIIFLLLLPAVTSFSQSSDFFIPAAFNNPFLRSGQFVTSLYYYRSAGETSVVDGSDTRSEQRNINFVGLLGLTDQLTLRTDISLYPQQTVYEIVQGGTGIDKETFNVSPSLTLSYRPVRNLEIFGNFDYRNFTRESGEKGLYQDVQVGVDGDGNPIYEKRLFTVDALDYTVKSTSVAIGISYLGKLW